MSAQMLQDIETIIYKSLVKLTHHTVGYLFMKQAFPLIAPKHLKPHLFFQENRINLSRFPITAKLMATNGVVASVDS